MIRLDLEGDLKLVCRALPVAGRGVGGGQIRVRVGIAGRHRHQRLQQFHRSRIGLALQVNARGAAESSSVLRIQARTRS